MIFSKIESFCLNDFTPLHKCCTGLDKKEGSDGVIYPTKEFKNGSAYFCWKCRQIRVLREKVRFITLVLWFFSLNQWWFLPQRRSKSDARDFFISWTDWSSVVNEPYCRSTSASLVDSHSLSRRTYQARRQQTKNSRLKTSYTYISLFSSIVHKWYVVVTYQPMHIYVIHVNDTYWLRIVPRYLIHEKARILYV